MPQRDPEIYGPIPQSVTVENLIPTRTTTLGAIEYVKMTVSGSAGVQLDTGESPVVVDGALKARIDMTFTPTTAKVVTVAGWTKASRQVIDDNEGLESTVNDVLLDAVSLATQQQILSGSGLTGNLAGLLIEAAAYSRHVGGDTWADTLRRAVTQVQIARGVATGAVVHPVALEHMELEKDQQDRYVMVLEVTDNSGRTVIWRIPVVVTDAISETKFLVGDFVRSARLYDRQQSMVQIGFVDDDMIRNLITLLCERRLALTIPRPDLLVTGTFGES